MTRFALGWITGAISTLLGVLLVHLYGFWQSGAEETRQGYNAGVTWEYDGEAVGV